MDEVKADQFAQSSLLEDFQNQFALEVANSEVDKRRAYAVRHEVFREELNYALGEDLDSPLERDKYDRNAILCLLRHRPSGEDAGCLRVAVAPPGDANRFVFPFEENCGERLNHDLYHPRRFSRPLICEVSRLAVRARFRKNRKELVTLDNPADSLPETPGKQHHALISVSLFLAATALVGLSGRRHVFAVMEPRFARLLGISGLKFQRAGEMITYCGQRAPYYIDQQRAEVEMHEDLKPLYRHVKAQLAPQLETVATPRRYLRS